MKDQHTYPNQSNFWPGRGCTSQMHNLRHTLGHRWSFQQTTVMSFVDFASAFDSMDRDSLWRLMSADGLSPQTLEGDQGLLGVDKDGG